MKIAFLKSRLSHQGGLERYTSRLAQAFEASGSQATILTTGEAKGAISLCPTSKFTLRHLRRFDKACKKWLKESSQDVVFGMERNTFQTHYRAGSGVHAAYLQRRRLSDPWWKMHALNPLHRYLLKVEKEAFEHPQLRILFTNSAMVREEILTLYQTPPEKVIVVHNGIDWKGFEPHFQASLQGQSSRYKFLFVGHGFERKGLSFLIQALRLLPHRDWHLSVVGHDSQLARYAASAKDLPISFHGKTDPLPFYQKADALVIPSLYDPFANVTIEGLAMGLTVLSSPYNGGKEILPPEAVFPSLDPEAIAATLLWALDHPKTAASAHAIRQGCQPLDFSRQLAKIVEATCTF